MPAESQRTQEFVAYFTKGLGDVAAGELREILRPGAAPGRTSMRASVFTGEHQSADRQSWPRGGDAGEVPGGGAGEGGGLAGEAGSREGGPGSYVGEPGERFVVVRTSAEGAGSVLAGARTVDDFRLLVAGPARVAAEEEFRALCIVAARRTEEFLAADPARARAPWSVTVSARHPAWARRPGWSPARAMAAAWPAADVTAHARAPVDLRVQVDGEIMHVAVSLGGPPPGRRAAQAAPRPGALRPTVGAAMVRMALAARPQAAPGGLYDPFTGTGTIVAEAWRLGLPVFASDADPEAVRMTRERMASLIAAGSARGGRAGPADEGWLGHRVFVHDVRDGVPGRVHAGLVAGNMPWGKQVQIPRRAELFDATARIVRQVVVAGGAAVLLTTHEEQFTARLRRALPGGLITTRRIGLLGQTPAIVLARPR